MVQKGCRKGHAEASCCFALALKDGIGVSIDLVESCKWLKVAAEGGIAKAQWLLSKSYRSGNGVAINIREADRWEKLASQGGYPK